MGLHIFVLFAALFFGYAYAGYCCEGTSESPNCITRYDDTFAVYYQCTQSTLEGVCSECSPKVQKKFLVTFAAVGLAIVLFISTLIYCYCSRPRKIYQYAPLPQQPPQTSPHVYYAA
eukprot:Phypoly_transcript_29253.p1 GENE.Phypoly_transcript_29253~~Phypoly_transcript_29253.p1  ORF type:complete len:117 (+),score=2.74 Phypoly_transcript_29253:31-381(+)